MSVVALTEVICDHPSRGSSAYGLTFADRAEALSFALHMRRAGYSVDVSPEFSTEASVSAAVASAASYFDHPELCEGVS